jgi:hypothetical protein
MAALNFTACRRGLYGAHPSVKGIITDLVIRTEPAPAIGSTASRRPKEEIVGFKRVYTFSGGARSGKLQS